jgi:hypothetical protein
MPRTKIIQPTVVGLQADTSSSSATPKRAKTRPPASVRERERRTSDPLPRASSSAVQVHTPPVLSPVNRQKTAIPDYLALLMSQVQSAIRDSNWDKLGDLIERISDPQQGLNLRSLLDHPAVKQTLDMAAIDVLTAMTPATDEQLSLALDLLDIGANWNAEDAHGNSVLTILRKNMDDDRLQFTIHNYPNFKHLFVDREGRPITA